MDSAPAKAVAARQWHGHMRRILQLHARTHEKRAGEKRAGEKGAGEKGAAEKGAAEKGAA